MSTYIIRRLIQLPITVLGVTVFVFALADPWPGGALGALHP
jgi:ABC-type dipeptide/oligopeptide/nickel transport system permease component